MYVIVGTDGVTKLDPKSGLMGTQQLIPKGFPIPVRILTSYSVQRVKHNVDMGPGIPWAIPSGGSWVNILVGGFNPFEKY